MLRRLFDWAMDKVSGKEGERWLALLSFAESSFFPLPVDMLLVPMMLANHTRVWRLALVATLASVLGALFGDLIGAFLYETVAEPLIQLYGYTDAFARFEDTYTKYGVLVVLVAGLTPIPFKVATIASGVFGLNPVLFALMCVPARAPRFFTEAALFHFFGPRARDFIEHHLAWVMTGLVIIGIVGVIALNWI